MKMTIRQYERMNEALRDAYNRAVEANDGHLQGADESREFAFYDGIAQSLYLLGFALRAETATSCLQLTPENVA